MHKYELPYPFRWAIIAIILIPFAILRNIKISIEIIVFIVMMQSILYLLVRIIFLPRTPIFSEYEFDGAIVRERRMFSAVRELDMNECTTYRFRPKLRIISCLIVSRLQITKKTIRKVSKSKNCIIIPISGQMDEEWKKLLHSAVEI